MSYVPKILIVDDEPRMTDSLKILLGNEGYEIQTKHNGREALEAISKDDFDLLILDLILPDMKGSEIMDNVSRQARELFVIVITGHASSKSAIEALKRGAFDYIRKPFEHEELSKAVKNALRQKALIRDRKRAHEALQTAYDQAIIYAKELKKKIGEHKRAEEEKKKLEVQLLQAQKMESIGTLAGGVAHDFNNLLMGIQGYASLMLNDLHETHPHYRWTKRIEDLVGSGAGLTNQLLGFARGGKYDVRPTDINEVVKKSSNMFGRTRKEITIEGTYEQDLWTVEIDRGQIEQLLLNLYVNAWQAMPGGGTLHLETKNVRFDENYTKPYDARPGRYVKISVTDTGVGMDDATQRRIFDPFFTTKEMGRGAGLGLTSAYGIIKSHNGIINVSSKKGHGATFTVYLPVVETAVSAAGAVMRKEEIKRGSETILLVDDEQTVIDVGRELLGKLGHKVLLATGGREALNVCKANEDRIDLVILDMIMPEMGGSEVYNQMKKMSPDIKVLLSSGYSIDGQATEMLKRGCDGFIQKPFSMQKLSGKIRGILDKE